MSNYICLSEHLNDLKLEILKARCGRTPVINKFQAFVNLWHPVFLNIACRPDNLFKNRFITSAKLVIKIYLKNDSLYTIQRKIIILHYNKCIQIII